jgi:hypothetical protein
MACNIISNEGAVFVLWGKPNKADLERVIHRVELIASASQHPVVYVTRVPQNAPAPDADVRQFLNSLMPRFVKACSSYHVILEGQGFVSAFKRAMLISLLQFGWRNGTFFVHETDKGVFGKVARPDRPHVEAILATASAQGLLTAGPPEDVEPPHERPAQRRVDSNARL